ncbi:MAG: bifunctional diaminohydroxyphosphoribosylaminopyrimidine deaminase/5-amino-6-(5-phosphoribosylamino)uracil reductase RibD [Ignavibacteriales bacterium]|nr:bifunctional diaminohydroxyphosphoribosylaminopyrimidine deaminase/5-amino-6-(5-phosphoribosylamino)uracil reductase RibD [Ignavibacteriales bacterium]
MSRTEEKYLRRCLELADGGRAWAHPNPLVGCVIVRKGLVVGEGLHRRFGGAHAEVEALRSAGGRARGSTLYVNLEPCSHQGKTPPCTEAIIRAGVRTVVASLPDPNPIVSGRGFRALRRAGIRVLQGILRKEARQLNEKFFAFMETGLPFVGVKVAQTLDGRIGDVRGDSRWITTALARAYGHRLRSEYDAILVGATTVRRDDPELTVRLVKGRNPHRVVLDGTLSIPASSRVCATKRAPTIVLTSQRAMSAKRNKVVQLERLGVQVFGIRSRSTRLTSFEILHVLADLGISSVIVEGGAETIRLFLQERQAKKMYCFFAPKILGSGIHGITLSPRRLSKAIQILSPSVIRFDDNVMIEGAIKY